MTKFQHLQAVVLDWAGTTLDFGSRAPAFVFQEIFRQRGVPITVAQAREPMGMAKRDHIKTIASMPEVAAGWREKFGREWTEEDIDQMYAEFVPLQKSVLADYSIMIDGVLEMANELKAAGIKIGSSTGYTRELMDDVVIPAAKEQGYEADVVLGAEDAPIGRPAPFLIHEIARRLEIFPMWRIVKVDDTPVGVEAGRNAGCWSVGVTETGNCVGLSKEEFAALSADEQKACLTKAEERLMAAGAHCVVRSTADLIPILTDFDNRLAAGERPEWP